MDYQQIISSGPVIGGLITAAIAATLKTIKTILEFGEDFFIARHFRKYQILSEQAKGRDDLLGMIAGVKSELVFREIIGKPVTPNMSNLLLALYATGCFSLHELRRCHLYVREGENGSVEVRPGKLGVFVAGTAAVLTLLMACFSALAINSLASIKSPEALVAVLLITIIFIAFLWFVGPEMASFLVARQCQRRLEKQRKKI